MTRAACDWARSAAMLILVLLLAACDAASSATTAESTSPPIERSQSTNTSAKASGSTSVPRVSTSTTESVEVLVRDVIEALGDLHAERNDSGGSIVQVVFTDLDSLLGAGEKPAEVVDVVWTAAENPPEPGTELVVSIPRPLINSPEEPSPPLEGYVALGGDGETLSAGVVDPHGMFILPDNNAQIIPMAANALVREGFPAAPLSPAQVCAGKEPKREQWHGDAVSALREYFRRFPDTTYREEERQRRETEAKLRGTVDELFSKAGTMTDPVTGIASQADLNDLEYQLEQGIPPEEVELRPGIPLLLKLSEKGDPSRAVAFVAAPSFRVLGAANLAPRFAVDSEGSQGEVLEVIKWIAPPEPNESVLVIETTDDFYGIDCIDRDSKPTMEIPWESIAGETRVAIDLSTMTYEEITTFENVLTGAQSVD